MSVSDISIDALRQMDSVPNVPNPGPKLHRIATVRRQQGVSMRRLAHLLHREVRELRQEEDERCDMLLSRLYEWQRALDVPISDLLIESHGPLSPPVLQRAQLVRVMKTVAAILEKAENPGIRRLAQTLADQLVQIMPELQGVSPWHSVGQRRSLSEYGRIVERSYPDDSWRDIDD
jgi:hypothetical protein